MVLTRFSEMGTTHTLLLLLLSLIQYSHTEFVGNLFPENGELFTGFQRSVYIIYDAVSMPYDGFVHAFHAQIKEPNEEVRFQVWRVDPATRNSTLIGEQSFTTTTAHLQSLNTTFMLTRSIAVKQGDKIGFWNIGPANVVASYATGDFVINAQLFKENINPSVGDSFIMNRRNSNNKIALGVTLELFPLQAFTTPDGATAVVEMTTTEVMTTEPLPRDRVYGRPDLEGSEWTDVAEYRFLSIVVDFTEPMRTGYLNRIQLYSVRRGIALKFQIIRSISADVSSRQFLVADEFPYTTKLSGGFENTTIWNAQIFDGDLLGVTVVDGSKGFPIGRESISGGGERIYIREGSFSAQRIPLRGVTYNDFIYVNNNHALAMAAFTSDDMKSDDGTDNVTETTTEPATTLVPQSTTPLNGGTELPISTTPINSEIIIGNKDVVDSNENKEVFQPFNKVTMVLADLKMRRDGEVRELGFYASSKLLPVEIGIYRPTACAAGSCYTKIFSTVVTPSDFGPVVLPFEEPKDSPIAVLEGDVLGFYNLNTTSLVVGRVGVGSVGDDPYMRIGNTALGVSQPYNRYIKGYEYAIYAILSEVPTTTTQTTTTTTQTTTTTVPTTTTTTATTTTTIPTTTTTTMEPTTTTTTMEPTTTTTTMEPTTTTTTMEPTTTTTTVEPTTTTVTTTTMEPTTTTTEPTTTEVTYVTGQKGEQGQQGPVGPQGSTGAKGEQGSAGPAGAPGDKGEQGLPGDDGSFGEMGATGSTGATGDRGATGSTGSTGSQGAGGQRGEAGAPGEAGLRGDRGLAGAQGEKGAQGPKGAPGIKGDMGDKGSQGMRGPSGDTGGDGEVGEVGERGADASLTLVNECSPNLFCSGDNKLCTDTELSFTCGCTDGYSTLSGPGGECVDIDECEVNNGMCQQKCENTAGSRRCSCESGYTLSPNERTCEDIDECGLSTHNCSGGERCFNEPGSHKCIMKQTIEAAKLAQIESAGGEDWWGLVTLGLILWAFILTIVLIIVCIVLCVDAKNNKKNKYAESLYSDYASQ